MFPGGVPSLPSKSFSAAGSRPTPGGSSGFSAAGSRPSPGGGGSAAPSSPAPFNLFAGGMPGSFATRVFVYLY
mgnify:CR=1 FL=1